MQLLFAFLIGYACATDADKEAQLKSSYNSNDGHGHFQYGLDVSNGIEAKAQGDVNSITGEYYLIGEDGQKIKVTYTADSTGFHPVVHN